MGPDIVFHLPHLLAVCLYTNNVKLLSLNFLSLKIEIYTIQLTVIDMNTYNITYKYIYELHIYKLTYIVLGI